MKGFGRHVCGILGAVIFAGAIHAADDDKILYPGKTVPAATPAGGGMGSASLVVGLALAAAGGWLVWRNRRPSPRASDGRALTIAETRSLGNRQYLVVATYEDKKFLLGVCSDRIELLAPLHEEKRLP